MTDQLENKASLGSFFLIFTLRSVFGKCFRSFIYFVDYPCPLIGNRNRKPVFFEIGHTIMNLLADFRNYQYMLPNIRGITIHMEDKVTKINFPRNRYEDVRKSLARLHSSGSIFNTALSESLILNENFNFKW